MRDDISSIKENHLAHIEKDMANLRTTMAVVRTRLEPVEKFVEQWNQKMMVLFISAVSASVGIPMLL
jgi:hypothetical protein